MSISGCMANQPARCEPTWRAVAAAVAASISTGEPTAQASRYCSKARSMRKNQKTASSTEWPTVKCAWLRQITALPWPRLWAMRSPSDSSLAMPP
ncbi:hypothetical protein A8M77_26785 [Variovorax sp. JS1663]|nr:hypothetical protein A8M77_26785 [Variovorax sp. JS1663]